MSFSIFRPARTIPRGSLFATRRHLFSPSIGSQPTTTVAARMVSDISSPPPATNGTAERPCVSRKPKLTGRAFYESIGSPKLVLAPMVDQSEFAWRMLSRSFLSQPQSLLAYTPMFHSRLFTDSPKYRDTHFQATKIPLPSPPDAYHAAQLSENDLWLDGHPKFDRPLFVQFCSNKKEDLLAAAKHVAPFCDAVDLNLGCPQGIAKRGHYGAFLQEDWDLIAEMIGTLREELEVPITAKMRVLDTKEKTLEYAKTILGAGASILTVHGRQRDQKGHKTGLADWSILRYLRENLPAETVLFANGNILEHGDIESCLEATGFDGVMSAEGNLYDPSIFAEPPPEDSDVFKREYWRGINGKGGYRMDAVMRRYLDIIYRYVLGVEPPARKPLWALGDSVEEEVTPQVTAVNGAKRPADSQNQSDNESSSQPPKKKQKRKGEKKEPAPHANNPNMVAMQAHLFHLLRPLVSKYHNVRDALARSRSGDLAGFENVLAGVEKAVQEGIQEYAKDPEAFEKAMEDEIKEARGKDKEKQERERQENGTETNGAENEESSYEAVKRCKKPWFVCQPYVRPLPAEALKLGSLTLSKKEKAKLEKEQEAGPENRLEKKMENGEHPGEDGVDMQKGVVKEGVVAG